MPNPTFCAAPSERKLISHMTVFAKHCHLFLIHNATGTTNAIIYSSCNTQLMAVLSLRTFYKIKLTHTCARTHSEPIASSISPACNGELKPRGRVNVQSYSHMKGYRTFVHLLVTVQSRVPKFFFFCWRYTKQNLQDIYFSSSEKNSSL
jgi:hypothetical protein